MPGFKPRESCGTTPADTLPPEVWPAGHASRQLAAQRLAVRPGPERPIVGACVKDHLEVSDLTRTARCRRPARETSSFHHLDGRPANLRLLRFSFRLRFLAIEISGRETRGRPPNYRLDAACRRANRRTTKSSVRSPFPLPSIWFRQQYDACLPCRVARRLIGESGPAHPIPPPPHSAPWPEIRGGRRPLHKPWRHPSQRHRAKVR